MQVFLHLGTNVGDKKENLHFARTALTAYCGTIIKASSLYLTEAWGNQDQDDFINQALEIETDLSPEDLLKKTKQIEKDIGPEKTARWGPRLLDIDIIFYGHQTIALENLTIPHPRIIERNFVLIPMMEVAGDFIHPVFGESIEDLYIKCKDPLEVVLL